MADIYFPVALKMYSYGLTRLTDPNWTGGDFYENLRTIVKKGDILQKTLKEGILYHMGVWLYQEYLVEWWEYRYFIELSGEDRLWYLEDLVEFLLFHGVSENDTLMLSNIAFINSMDELFETDEFKYYDKLTSKIGIQRLLVRCEQLRQKYKPLIKKQSQIYAASYADRVFHDRELCGFISQVIVTIGFSGDWQNNEIPQQWIERRRWPEWTKEALRARERGKCANCGLDLISELSAKAHIDHIIPLSKGGNNDLVNLQMLCQQCNLSKSNSEQSVKTSVPTYISRKILKS